MNKKLVTTFMISALTMGAGIALTYRGQLEKASATTNYVIATNGCQAASDLPTTIYLDEVEKADVRAYYSSLNGLDESERKGTNLLKNLKSILYNMNYYAYGGWSKNGVSTIYSITDRDWVNSPISSFTSGTYNSSNNTITKYNHVNELHANPYIHMLYVDYSVETATPAKKNLSDQNPYFDKEHVWCQSRGFKAHTEEDVAAIGPAGTDLHHLIAGDSYVNQKPHNNNPYGFVATISSSDGTGNRPSTVNNKKGTAVHTSIYDEASEVFEPQDSDKGDIARAIFYMAARYNNWSGTDTITDYEPFLDIANYATSSGRTEYSTATSPVCMGILSDLLAWNKIDPVDEYEIHRNDLIYRNYQGNRNPFIDFPQWADYIWGTADLQGNNYNSTPTGSADPAHDVVYYKGNDGIHVTDVTLNETSLSIDRFVTPTVTLTATISPNNATNKAVTWTTSDATIATVSNGVVTALKAGTVTITVTSLDGGISASCTITITDTTPVVTSVTLNTSVATVDISRIDQVQLTATVNGDNFPPASVTWSSNNTSVATVSDSGLVTGVATGIATITATSTYDTTKKAICTIKVINSENLADTINCDVLGITSNSYTSWTHSFDTDIVYKGNSAGANHSIQLRTNTGTDGVHAGIVSTTTIGPLASVDCTWVAAATQDRRKIEIYGSNAAYSSPDDLYDNSKKGTLLGTIEKGATTLAITGTYRYVGVKSSSGALYLGSLTFTWDGNTEYVAPTGVSLNKSSILLAANGTETLVPTVAPADATYKDVTWSSNDEAIATVDNNGVVTGVNAGTTTIVVETQDGHLTASCTVTVKSNPQIKRNNYATGVSYKMYLQTKGYFNGGVGSASYLGQTDTNYSNGVDVKFETVNSKLRLYFMDGETKKYIVAYLNATYDNFGIFTEEELSGKTVFDWYINSDGRLVAECRGVVKTLGLKSGQTFTTFALNALSATVKFMEFEYTAESYAYDFLDNITCDSSGATSPVYSDGFTWNDFKLIYNNLFGSEKTILSTTAKNVDGNVIERMLARYEYLVWKYHYEDFLSRDVVLSSNSSMFEISNSNNTIVLVLTIIVSASAIGTALLIQKKRKEH